MMSTWDDLCRAHYAGPANAGPPSFSAAADEAEHRAWLCGPDVIGSRYVAAFATTPMRTWPIREVRDVVRGARLIALCDPDRPASDMLVGERFVCDRVAPCLARTYALLLAAIGTATRTATSAATRAAPEIVVTYVDATKRRTMPASPSEVVGAENINGGVTYHLAGPQKRIIVYRREDACKVLVHELVHAFGLDAALWTHLSRAAHDADRAFAKQHRVSAVDPAKPLGLGEAYAETLATYLHAHWWHHQAPGARREDATLGRVAAHVEDVGRRVDALCSRGGTREFLELTHAFAYAVCRAAIWSTGALPEMLKRWPPGSPPKDPAAFATFLTDAIQSWDRKRSRGGSIPRGLMMTPLQ